VTVTIPGVTLNSPPLSSLCRARLAKERRRRLVLRLPRMHYATPAPPRGGMSGGGGELFWRRNEGMRVF